jgi:ActR/RegA family two-component response regulator
MSIRILVVDDNRDTLRTYVKALRLRIRPKEWETTLTGEITEPLMEVEEADTVTLSLKKLKEKPFEILVVDLKIPGPSGEEMGGLEIITESIRLDPLRRVIVITGYGTVDLARKALRQGVFDFIEKSATAVDDLINAVERAIGHLDEKIKRSGNPFTPMTGVEPTVFGGRTRELEFFEHRLNRALHSRFCEHFLVLGNWGIGKSTLLKEYKKICQSRGHLASIVPLEALQPGTKLTEAAHSMVEGVFRDLPYPIDRFKKVATFFESIGISVLGTGLQLKRDISKKELSAQAFFHDTMINLWKDLEDKTGAFVILLDDLDNFIATPEIIMTLKQTLSMDSIIKTKILVGIASTPSNWQELTSIKKHHPLSRYFLSRVELGPLTESEMKETILKSLVETGVSFSSDVIDRVFEYTEGHPFEMQVLCNHLFNNQLSRRVEIDIWDKALQATLNDMGIAIFGHWFGQASSEEAKVLRIIGGEEFPILAKEINRMSETGAIKVSPGNVTKYLQRLVEKRLINKSSRGLYSVPDRMFRAYIRTHSD